MASIEHHNKGVTAKIASKAERAVNARKPRKATAEVAIECYNEGEKRRKRTPRSRKPIGYDPMRYRTPGLASTSRAVLLDTTIIGTGYDPNEPSAPFVTKAPMAFGYFSASFGGGA